MDSLIIFGAKYLVIFIVLVMGVTWLRVSKRHKLQFILATLIAGVIAVLLDKVAGKLYYDPRPFVGHSFKPLVAHAADNGFPSEHTLLSMTLATVTYFFSKKLGVLAFVTGLLVGVSRVAAHVHSPIDIAGATIIGLISGWTGYKLMLKIKRRGGEPGGHR